MLVILSSILTVIFVILFSQDPTLLFCLLSLQLLVLNYFIDLPLLFYLLVGLGGVGAEILAVNFGNKTWTYKQNDLMGVPIWLFPLWSLAGAMIIYFFQIAKYL